MSKDEMEISDGEASSPGSQSDSQGNNENPKSSSSNKKKSGKASKPRLTAVQKNTNHKDAENKRRNAIRERFTDLSHLVPDAEGHERSEQVMLSKTKTYLQDSLEELRRLEALAAERNINLSEEDKLKDTDYGGRRWKSSNMDKYEAQRRKKASVGGLKSGDVDYDIDADEDDQG